MLSLINSNRLVVMLLLSALLHGVLLLSFANDSASFTVAEQGAIMDVELLAPNPVIKSSGQQSRPHHHKQKYRVHHVPSADVYFADDVAALAKPDVMPELVMDAEMEQVSTAENHEQFVSLLHQAINSHKQYPYQAQRQRREGRVRLSFVVHPDGQVTDVVVVASSHFSPLDDAARAAVSSIAPFQLAQNYIRQANVFDVDIDFRLN